MIVIVFSEYSTFALLPIGNEFISLWFKSDTGIAIFRVFDAILIATFLLPFSFKERIIFPFSYSILYFLPIEKPEIIGSLLSINILGF